MKTKKIVKRRDFIRTTSVAFAGLTIIPNRAVSGLGHIAPSDKLNVAIIGFGGRGSAVVAGIAPTENIVALCDVDWSDRTAKIFGKFPKAAKYKDYRIMLDKQKDIDAVGIATPDHTHAIISMAAIKRGKHVYCEKPLTHSVHEAQVLAKAARDNRVATQMGNTGQAGDSPRRLREMIWSGAIGQVREVHAWTDRPNNGYFGTYWPQGVNRPTDTQAAPATMDWDLWIGPAPMRPWNPAYHPSNWRGWLDFGNGALGDMGCHIFDPIFRVLNLKYPTSVQAVSSIINQETYPLSSMVRYEFPKRQDMYMPTLELPPVSLTWYDGGFRPLRFFELEEGEQMGNKDRGTLYIGDKGKIFDDKLYPKSLRESYKPPTPYIPSSPGHFIEWINACKGGEPAGSNFDWGGPLTETVLLGNIALRKELREKLSTQVLKFDADKLSFSNCPEANNFLTCEYRKGWEL